MGIFVVLMIFSLILFILFFVTLVWSVKDGQMEDLSTPKERMLWEDKKIE